MSVVVALLVSDSFWFLCNVFPWRFLQCFSQCLVSVALLLSDSVVSLSVSAVNPAEHVFLQSKEVK